MSVAKALQKLILKVTGPQTSKTRITNKSDVPILLIPCCKPEGSNSAMVIKALAKVIQPRGGEEYVDSSEYDRHKLGVADSQIHIFFLAGKDGDVRGIGKILEDDYRKGVTIAADEKKYLHTGLLGRDKLDLCVDEKKKVTEWDKKADQTSNINEPTAAGTSIESDVAHLKKTAENLQKLATDLLNEVKGLESRLSK